MIMHRKFQVNLIKTNDVIVIFAIIAMKAILVQG